MQIDKVVNTIKSESSGFYLLETTNSESILHLEEEILKSFYEKQYEIDTSFIILEPEEKSKFITIDQIRKMKKEFLHTNVLNLNKVIFVREVNYLNINALNGLLKKYFIKNNIKSTFTREPGGNKDLEKIRNVILKSNFDNLSLIMYFFASRFALLSSIKKNDFIVFDRFFDSTYAYQKYNSKEKKLIISLIKLIPKKFIPNITFYLKLDKKNLISRKNKRLYSNKFDKKYFGQFSRIQ